jgi:SsrA-binding protein
MILLKNKKALHQYEIKEKIQAGIVLTGPEVKSLRNKSGSLAGSYVKSINNELFLIGAQITPYKFADNTDYDPKRTRKILVRKKQVFHVMAATEKKGWSAIPLSLELDGKNIKLIIGIGKGRKEFEKREVLKNRALKREMQKEIKNAHLKI